MSFKDLLPYIVAIVVPIFSGLWSFLASTKKSREELTQIKEQNKHDLDLLMSQHKLELSGLELKHKMEIEKIELEHKNKIELMQKETENQLSSGLINSIGSGLINQAMQMPEVKNQLRASFQKGKSKKH